MPNNITSTKQQTTTYTFTLNILTGHHYKRKAS